MSFANLRASAGSAHSPRPRGRLVARARSPRPPHARSPRPRGRLVCLVACLFLISLSACAEPTPPPEPVTITFLYREYDASYYEPLIETFNAEHPLIIVEPRPLSRGLANELSTGGVDVFVDDPYTLGELQAEGLLLNLDPFLERDVGFDLSDFYPGTVDLLTFEGRTWAIPAGVDVLVMFYNRDMFDANNVPYPEIGWTFDDFLSSAVATNNPDAGFYGYATPSSTVDPDFFDAVLFTYMRGGQLFDDLQNPGHTTFNDQVTVEALEWYADLYHEYDVAPTPQEARATFRGTQWAYFQGIRTGRVGMWIGSLSDRDGMTWDVEWLVNWGVAPLPSAVQEVTQAEIDGYAIYGQTEHPDACWEWITFLSRQMHSRLVPPRRSLTESAAYGQLVGEEVAAVARVSMEGAVLINPRVFGGLGAAMDIYGDAVEQVVNEEATPQEALDWAQREAETRLQ